MLARLPGDGIGLAVLAAETTGDAHGLDRGRPTGTLVLHALGSLADEPPPQDAGEWRAAWQAAGVVCDDLSCHVLVMNLRPRGSTELIGGMVRDHADFGEPVRLTLRQVSAGELEPESATTIFCCENPAVLAAAADRLGEESATLVCLEGVPSTAGLVLLERLAAAGCPLRYHGDFDWAGLSIFSTLRRRLEVSPWQFGATTTGRWCVTEEAASHLPVVGPSRRGTVPLRPPWPNQAWPSSRSRSWIDFWRTCEVGGVLGPRR